MLQNTCQLWCKLHLPDEYIVRQTTKKVSNVVVNPIILAMNQRPSSDDHPLKEIKCLLILCGCLIINAPVVLRTRAETIFTVHTNVDGIMPRSSAVDEINRVLAGQVERTPTPALVERTFSIPNSISSSSPRSAERPAHRWNLQRVDPRSA